MEADDMGKFEGKQMSDGFFKSKFFFGISARLVNTHSS